MNMFTGIYRFYKETKSKQFEFKSEAISELEETTLNGRSYALCVYDNETKEIVWIASTETLASVTPYYNKILESEVIE